MKDPKCKVLALEMLSHMEDEDYLKRVMFPDEACFYVLGKVNQHNLRICGSENPLVAILTHATVQRSMCGVAFSS